MNLVRSFEATNILEIEHKINDWASKNPRSTIVNISISYSNNLEYSPIVIALVVYNVSEDL